MVGEVVQDRFSRTQYTLLSVVVVAAAVQVIATLMKADTATSHLISDITTLVCSIFAVGLFGAAFASGSGWRVKNFPIIVFAAAFLIGRKAWHAEPRLGMIDMNPDQVIYATAYVTEAIGYLVMLGLILKDRAHDLQQFNDS